MSSWITFERGSRAECESRVVEIGDLGMRFLSKWRFEVGTELRVGWRESGGAIHRESEAWVVDCRDTGCGCHETTLLFIGSRAGGPRAVEVAYGVN